MTFLQAEWRKLIMANYAIDKGILEKYLPKGTEIDLWNDVCYVSLVGFMFMDTKMLGLKFPFHINFEEVNLRFYVKYKDHGSWKRGVVFIKEIVPKPALTFVANTVYKEHYETLPMKHAWADIDNMISVEYKWKKKSWNTLKVVADNNPIEILANSEEAFITEHYWGYTQISDQITSEYEVVHPKWKVYPVREFFIEVDFNNIYGKDFDFLTFLTPKSVFLAEGSHIKVNKGRRITTAPGN